jgi:integrase
MKGDKSMGGHRANGPAPDTGGTSPMSAASSQTLVRTSTPGVYRKGSRYIVVFRDPRGRQRKRSARTLAEARTLKAALTTDVHRFEYLEQSKVTFTEYAARWIASYDGRTSRGIRTDTLSDYRRQLGLDEDGEPTGKGACGFFGRTPLAAVTAQDVKAYAAEIAATGAARNTVRLAIAPVKAMLATAHEEGILRSNPAAGLRLGRTVAQAPVKTVHALTEDEVVLVLAKVPERHRLLVETLAQTGLRISELLALTKADIDFGRRRLSVSKRLSRGELGAPKSKNGVRVVPLSPGLAQRLWKQLATADDATLVFAGDGGEPCSRSYLYRVVNEAGERAGIEWPVGLHTFRHSCASIMFRRGVPKEAIRRLLGHHSWDFTAGTYVHVDDDDLPDGAVVGDLTAPDLRTVPVVRHAPRRASAC